MSATHCWAVGQGYDASGNLVADVVSVVNGAPGVVQHVPALELKAVACSGAAMCVAVGNDQAGVGVVVLIRQGKAGAPQEVSGTSLLEAVACQPVGRACVAVGYVGTPPEGVVVPISSGAVGSAEQVAAAGALNGVACPSASCFAVGAAPGGGNGGTVVPISSSKAGTAIAVGAEMAGIACSSSDHCVAVGLATMSGGNGTRELGALLSIVRGGRAASVSKDYNTGPLKQVACAAPTACIATGYATDLSASGIVLIANGVGGGLLASGFEPLGITFNRTVYLASGTVVVQDKYNGRYYFLGAIVSYPRPSK